MNIFTEHTTRQGVTYLEHMIFAMRIAIRLLNSGIAFSLHATLPFINIKKELDLEATEQFLREQNNWIESMKQNKSLHSINDVFLQAKN